MSKTSTPPPLLETPVIATEDLQTDIIRRLGLERLPTHETRWLPMVSIVVPGEETVRVPKSLAESIRLFGVLQPPSVVHCSSSPADKDNPLYEVISGRRRTLAARLAGQSLLKVEVYAYSTPQLSAMLALIENAQRSAAWMKEVADLRMLIHQRVGLTMEELVACGFARQGLVERLKMAQLPEPLLDQIVSGKVALAVARKLVRLTPGQLARIIQVAREEPLTADLVKQALKVQISASLSPRQAVFPSWDIPAISSTSAGPQASETERLPDEHLSLTQVLAALRSFTQGCDYRQIEDAHILVQALIQRLEVAVRENSIPTLAS